MDSEKKYLHVLKSAILEEVESIQFFVENIDKLNYRENKRLIDRLSLDTIKHTQTLVKLLHLTYRPDQKRMRSGVHKQARKKLLDSQKVYHRGHAKAHPKVQKHMRDLFEAKEAHEQMVLMMK